MNDSHDLSLTERLERLERDNAELVGRLRGMERRTRGNRFLGLMIVACATVGPAIASAQRQAGPRAVESESFVLRDRSGKVKGLWETTAEGMPTLALYDNSGRPRTEFLFRPDGSPSLRFLDPDGRERVLLGIERNGDAAIGVMGARAKERISLGADRLGRMSFCFYDGALRDVISMDANTAGAVRTRGLNSDQVVPASAEVVDQAPAIAPNLEPPPAAESSGRPQPRAPKVAPPR